MNAIKSMLCILGLTLAYSSSAQNMSSRPMQENSKDYQQTVRESLVTLRGMINADNAEAMGFRSEKEVEQAQAGVPIPILIIQLDELRAYQRGTDVRTLFKNYQQQLLPLTVGNEVRSSITLERKDQRLSTISYGSPMLARTLNKVRQETARQKNIPVEKFYAVHIAALRQYFVAYDDTEGKVMFVPVMNDATLNFRAGSVLSADDALLALKTAAQRYNEKDTSR